MVKKFLVTKQDKDEIGYLLGELRRQLKSPDGTSAHPREIYNAIHKLVYPEVGAIAGMRFILRRILEDEVFVIGECDGAGTFANSPELFSRVNASLQIGDACLPSPETTVEIYETKNHATPAEIFIPIADELRAVCLTENQIAAFIKEYFSRLHLSFCSPHTIFLQKKNKIKGFIVTRVYAAPSGSGILCVREDDFRKEEFFFHAGVHIVIPKLAS